MLGIRISLEQGPAGSHCRVCLERSERMNERYSSSPSLYDSHSPSSGYGIPSGRRVLPGVVNVATAAARKCRQASFLLLRKWEGLQRNS